DGCLDVRTRNLQPRSLYDVPNGMLLVIEVNAKFLLEEQWRPENVRFSAQRAKVLSRPDVRKSQSHRQILLIHPGFPVTDLPEYIPEELQLPPFAEIDLKDSEVLLDGLELVPHLGQCYLSREVSSRKKEEILNIWQRSPKVQDPKQYL